jgi:hypothetical protein
LREHYWRKREYYAVQWPAPYDKDLGRIFSQEPQHARRPTAASLLRRFRGELRHVVAEGTGVHHYTVDHLLENMIDRCRELKLRVATKESYAKQQSMIMLTVQTMNVVHAGYHRIAL